MIRETKHKKYKPRTKRIPPNDKYNFFFKQEFNGNFSNRGYKDSPTYKKVEVQKFLEDINRKFKTKGLFLCYTTPICTMVILMLLLAFDIEVNEKPLFMNFILIIVGFIIYL